MEVRINEYIVKRVYGTVYSGNILLHFGGSDGVCSQGRLNSLFIIFMKHANFFRVLIRLFSISSLNL